MAQTVSNAIECFDQCITRIDQNTRQDQRMVSLATEFELQHWRCRIGTAQSIRMKMAEYGSHRPQISCYRQ